MNLADILQVVIVSRFVIELPINSKPAWFDEGLKKVLSEWGCKLARSLDD